MSNTSSPGSQHLSRELSPFEQGAFAESGIADNSSSLLQEDERVSRRADSMSRSASPHPLHVQNAISHDQRAGISSSYTSKPQSPPALIIPSQPSPSLQPIVTTTAAPGSDSAPGGIHLPKRNSSMGVRVTGGGGLLPPADPALEHLTGMAGISPIGPSTDGPMIYIQPSTPISGLKDGRGIFDAAIRHAEGMGQQDQRGGPHQMQSQQGQSFDGFSIPPPASHSLSRTHSNLQYSHQAGTGAQQNGPDFGADGPFQGNSGWLESENVLWGDHRSNGQLRPRAKSDSFMGASASDLFDRQMLLAMAADPQQMDLEHDLQHGKTEFRSNIDTWRAALSSGQGHRQHGPVPTMDPRNLLESREETVTDDHSRRQLQMAQQPSQLDAAERGRRYALDTNRINLQSGVFKYEPGEFSPTSLAFYQQLGINPIAPSQLGGISSAPFSQANFQNIPQHIWPQTALPGLQNYLTPAQPGIGPRRRSFAEGTNHPAFGAGTPGYGMGFAVQSSPIGPARVRTASPGFGHRRAVKSEDLGQGTGWGIAGAGSTYVTLSFMSLDLCHGSADFLHSITANDGTLLPPARGRSNSHSRHSSVSSARSASPALSISSQGSSFSHHSPRMDLIDDMVDLPVPVARQENRRRKVAKMKVTSMATEVASTSRRTNDGVFQCPGEWISIT